MELLVVVLVACVLAIPIVAIVALAKTGSLRDELRQQSDRVLNLELELSTIKRDLARAAAVNTQAQTQPVADAAAQAAPWAAPTAAAAAAPAVEQSPGEAAYPVRVAIEGFVYRQQDAAAVAAGTEAMDPAPRVDQVPPAVAPRQTERISLRRAPRLRSASLMELPRTPERCNCWSIQVQASPLYQPLAMERETHRIRSRPAL